MPVIWVQHSREPREGRRGWRIVPELPPGDAEPLVTRATATPSRTPTLETVLAGLEVGRLIVAGAQTDACIRSTLHGALARGYDATLVSDAQHTEDQTAWGAPHAGQGDHPHQPLLDLPARPSADRRYGEDRGGRLRSAP